ESTSRPASRERIRIRKTRPTPANQAAQVGVTLRRYATVMWRVCSTATTSERGKTLIGQFLPLKWRDGEQRRIDQRGARVAPIGRIEQLRSQCDMTQPLILRHPQSSSQRRR